MGCTAEYRIPAEAYPAQVPQFSDPCHVYAGRRAFPLLDFVHAHLMPCFGGTNHVNLESPIRIVPVDASQLLRIRHGLPFYASFSQDPCQHACFRTNSPVSFRDSCRGREDGRGNC